MAEYIERESLAKEGWYLQRFVYGNGYAAIETKKITDIPAANVVPMDFHERCLQIEIQKRTALERKHGKWRKILQNADGTSDYECSVCAGLLVDVPDDDEHPLYSFCPNCGADMREES